MTLLDTTRGALATWPEPVIVDGDRVAVRTPVLYPSNALVTVFVVGGASQLRASDGRGAIQEADAIDGAERTVARIAKAFGLMATDQGEIYSPMVEQPKLAAMISLVANASRQASIELLRSNKHRAKRDIKGELRPLLTSLFPKSQVHYGARILGKSNKSYAFDFVVDLGGERRLLVDAVVPESSSINAAAVAHLDVGQTNNIKFKQAIVYDETEEWKASDLGVLKLGASPIPMSQAPRLLAEMSSSYG